MVCELTPPGNNTSQVSKFFVNVCVCVDRVQGTSVKKVNKHEDQSGRTKQFTCMEFFANTKYNLHYLNQFPQ